MAIPSGIMKYRGNWSVQETYLYADMVVSPINSNACVLIVTTLTGGSDPSVPSANWVLVPSGSEVYQATYYKTAVQNLIGNNTDVTFDGVGAWSNPNGYIIHTNGTKDFTVVQTGLYQLEFNVFVLVNNGAWTTTNNKTCNIDITRPTILEQGILTTTSLQAVQNYGQSVCGRVYLIAGDILNMRVRNVFTGGAPTPPQIQCLLNTFDLNTFFTWTLIKAL